MHAEPDTQAAVCYKGFFAGVTCSWQQRSSPPGSFQSGSRSFEQKRTRTHAHTRTRMRISPPPPTRTQTHTHGQCNIFKAILCSSLNLCLRCRMLLQHRRRHLVRVRQWRLICKACWRLVGGDRLRQKVVCWTWWRRGGDAGTSRTSRPARRWKLLLRRPRCGMMVAICGTYWRRVGGARRTQHRLRVRRLPLYLSMAPRRRPIAHRVCRRRPILHRMGGGVGQLRRAAIAGVFSVKAGRPQCCQESQWRELASSWVTTRLRVQRAEAQRDQQRWRWP